MKKLILLILTILPAAVWAQDSNFTLQVKMHPQGAGAKIFLVYPVAGKYIIDSAMFNQGTAVFKGTLTEPASAQLILDHQGVGLGMLRGKPGDIKMLYLEKGNISIAGKDSAATVLITGSKLNAESARYANALKPYENEMTKADAQYGVASASKNKARMDSLVAVYNKAVDERKGAQVQFIKQNPNSYLSLLILRQVGGEIIDPAVVEPLYKSLSPQVLQTTTGQNYGKSIAIAKATAIGTMAPSFTQNDVNDKPVMLASFRGKYVLLDFWASWCVPCRRENPNVVKNYQQYKSKNFTVLGVSLDRPGKKADWLAAIKNDGLEWTQVSDLNYGDNAVAKLYGVNSIPQNFLIDPNGKIIAKNLRGEELDKKLAELFK